MATILFSSLAEFIAHEQTIPQYPIPEAPSDPTFLPTEIIWAKYIQGPGWGEIRNEMRTMVVADATKEIDKVAANVASGGQVDPAWKPYPNVPELDQTPIPITKQCFIILELDGSNWNFSKAYPGVALKVDLKDRLCALRHYDHAGNSTADPSKDGANVAVFSVLQMDVDEKVGFHIVYESHSGGVTLPSTTDPDVRNTGGTHIP